MADGALRLSDAAMILLDTSALIDSLCGARRSAGLLRALGERGDRVGISSLVLYEWLRGPRLEEEIASQNRLFPAESILVFGAREAALSAELYRQVGRARGREMDLAIAAVAIVRNAEIWTLNAADFRDIPQVRLCRF